MLWWPRIVGWCQVVLHQKAAGRSLGLGWLAVRVLRQMVPELLRSLFDGILDPVDRRSKHREWSPGSLGYDYAMRRATVHLHLFGIKSGPGDGDVGDYRAVFQRSKMRNRINDCSDDGRHSLNLNVADIVVDEVNCAVLVDVRQLAKHEEWRGVGVPGNVPSKVSVQSLDLCDDNRINGMEPTAPAADQS